MTDDPAPLDRPPDHAGPAGAFPRRRRRCPALFGVLALWLAAVPGLSRAQYDEIPAPRPIPTAVDSAAMAPAPPPLVPTRVAPADSTVPERDLMDVIAAILGRDRVEPEVSYEQAGVAWSLLPSFNYNASYGYSIGASFSGAGTLGKDERAKPAALSLSGSYSTEQQLLLQLRGDVYSPTAAWLWKADVRYLDTPRSTWGLGPISDEQSEYPMSYKLLRVRASGQRCLGGPLYVGLGFQSDEFNDIVDERARQGESTPFTEYSGSDVTRTRATGFSLLISGDTRDNIVNPKKGYLLAGSFRGYPTSLGSDSDWQEFFTEVRLYTRMPKNRNNMVAVWLYSWFTFGPAPYLDLPAIGWDTWGRSGRGYLQGRTRGTSQLYLEGEYRVQLRRDGLVGAVAFVNATFTTVPDEQVFGRGDKAAGLGLRIKFNKTSDNNLVVDYGWNEHGSGYLTLAMSEAF